MLTGTHLVHLGINMHVSSCIVTQCMSVSIHCVCHLNNDLCGNTETDHCSCIHCYSSKSRCYIIKQNAEIGPAGHKEHAASGQISLTKITPVSGASQQDAGVMQQHLLLVIEQHCPRVLPYTSVASEE